MEGLQRAIAKGRGREVRSRNSRPTHGKKVFKQFLTNASHGISFSKDVILEMGPESVPYREANFHCLYNVSGTLAPIPKQKTHKKTTLMKPHAKDETTLVEDIPSLPPIYAQPFAPLTAKDSLTFSMNQDCMSDAFKKGVGGVFNVFNSLKQTTRSDKNDKARMEIKWDEFLLKKLTNTTAKWIVSQQIPDHFIEKPRLQTLLRRQYGSASATDLVSDDPMQEQDFAGFVEFQKQVAEMKGALESQAETPLPVYYRVQGYSLPTTNIQSGGVNDTAGHVVVKRIPPLQTPKLQDYLNPKAGKFVYHTDNNFQQELFLGVAKPMHQLLSKNHDRIIMDNNSEYGKNLEESYPCTPRTFMTEQEEMKDPNRAVVGRTERGLRRWIDLPTAADYTAEIGLIAPENMDALSLGSKQEQEQQPYEPMPELADLRYAVEKWRSAWNIKATWQSVTIEGLSKALNDLHYHVRLGAIATCASGAVNRPRAAEDPIDAAQFGRSWEVHPVPPDLRPMIDAALEDPIWRVQVAAAVCHYAMGAPDPKAREILRTALNKDHTGVGADSWMAAQCLAMEGEVSRAVIQRLLSQHFLSEAKTDREQAATLLSSLSSKTTLVRSLLAEELNCIDCKNREQACETISLLRSPINKDLSNKLVYMMWNDWSAVVRQKAAQALGKLGLGRLVHNELSQKLEDGPGTRRMEALGLIGHLHIMTAKLLPSFLLCLNDSFVSVRKLGCHTAGKLGLKDEMIMNQLLHLMQTDPIWEVKVAAIAALAKINCLTVRLRDLLLWALHHETEPKVRHAACEALRRLKVEGPELQQVLQERFALEPNLHVRRQIENILTINGYKLECDKGMVHKIKDQVQKMCNKNIITQKVLIVDDLKSLQDTKRRLQGSQAHLDAPEGQTLTDLLYQQLKSCKHAIGADTDSSVSSAQSSKSQSQSSQEDNTPIQV
ncbi:HEAT repeat-containing protein 4 [Engraulis encrasicolus]|uniref:HEAT repeat-containing protein 4 n=1 Tax=Engraulis encrasicolus TaxID=184585 RepID=UPI002FD78169